MRGNVSDRADNARMVVNMNRGGRATYVLSGTAHANRNGLSSAIDENVRNDPVARAAMFFDLMAKKIEQAIRGDVCSIRAFSNHFGNGKGVGVGHSNFRHFHFTGVRLDKLNHAPYGRLRVWIQPVACADHVAN